MNLGRALSMIGMPSTKSHSSLVPSLWGSYIGCPLLSSTQEYDQVPSYLRYSWEHLVCACILAHIQNYPVWQDLCKSEIDLLQGTWQVCGRGRIWTRSCCWLPYSYQPYSSSCVSVCLLSSSVMSQCTRLPIVSWPFPHCKERGLLRQNACYCFYVALKMFSLSVLFWQLLVTKWTRVVNNTDLRLTIKF